MHVSSLATMRRCLKRHLLTDPVLSVREPLRVLDVGGADYNGTYRGMFERLGASYTAADIAQGAGVDVDVVMTRADRLPFADGSFDVVISCQTFEHCWNFWVLFSEMARVCRGDGLLVVVAPSQGASHRFPVDCYRFLPDSFRALAEANRLQLVDCWQSSTGPFFDLAGVFRRGPVRGEGRLPDRRQSRALDEPVQNDYPPQPDPVLDAKAGSRPLGEFLDQLHRVLEPRNYLEIGVWRGSSLVKARCPALGVDPCPDIGVTLSANHRLMEMTSEDFFDTQDVRSLVEPLDLVFIDGLHLIEQALFDFINVERHSHPGTAVIIDDVYPNHPVQAQRRRTTQAWTGDVWLMGPILAMVRPDLILLPVDTWPTGALLVLGLDRQNDKLWSLYDLLARSGLEHQGPPQEVFRRPGAFAPDDRAIWRVLRELRRQRDTGGGKLDLPRLKAMIESSLPRKLVDLP